MKFGRVAAGYRRETTHVPRSNSSGNCNMAVFAEIDHRGDLMKKRFAFMIVFAALTLPHLAQAQIRLSLSDQRRFDSYYSRWQSYKATNNQSEVRSMEGRMQDVYRHYGIPANTPYGRVASNGGAGWPSGGWSGTPAPAPASGPGPYYGRPDYRDRDWERRRAWERERAREEHREWERHKDWKEHQREEARHDKSQHKGWFKDHDHGPHDREHYDHDHDRDHH